MQLGPLPAGFDESYTITGCANPDYCGTFHRVAANCNCDERRFSCESDPTLCAGAPVYERDGGGALLYAERLQSRCGRGVARCPPDGCQGCQENVLIMCGEDLTRWRVVATRDHRDVEAALANCAGWDADGQRLSSELISNGRTLSYTREIPQALAPTAPDYNTRSSTGSNAGDRGWSRDYGLHVTDPYAYAITVTAGDGSATGDGGGH